MNSKKEFVHKIYHIPVLLPKSLEPSRKTLEKVFIGAQRRLRSFAKHNRWEELVRKRFIDRAEIYDHKNKFDQKFLRLHGENLSIKLPKEVSAALEKRIFIAVSPDLYRKNFPEGIENRSYEKLITHEMAHRLHIRIVNGNEDAMGPVWFFEGFAIYAASQFENTAPDLNPDEIWKIVNTPSRGSYIKYASVFSYFLRKFSPRELVEHARDRDFIQWLYSI